MDEFASRLAALGRVQSLVGGSLNERIDLGDIVRLELRAIGAPDSKVSITGPPVALCFELVQTLGLALHELATNALKYGALKEESGRLEVSWQVRRGGQEGAVLLLDWQERGVRNLVKPSRRGFGTELIEKARRFTLHAKPELVFGEDGVSCHIEVPLSCPPADECA